MPSRSGASGGKRPGAGRKAGAAWKSARPPAIRAVARANVLDILQNHPDPLLGLLAIAEDREVDADVRVRAYIGALPFIRPRLSMSVSADVTPTKDDKVDKADLIARMLERLDSLRPSEQIDVLVNAAPEETG